MNRLSVISDLHLTSMTAPSAQALLAWIDARAKPGETIVLAGDVFDVFAGAVDVWMARYADVFERCHRATLAGASVHWIEGNHDFHLASALRDRAPAVHLHSDGVTIRVGKRRVRIEHGDLADRSDYGYRALRLAFRSPVMGLALALTPGKWMVRFGEWASSTSAGRSSRLASDLPEEKLLRLRACYRDYAAAQAEAHSCDIVILGHCHDLDEARIKETQYLNVGFPPRHQLAIELRSGESEWATRVPFGA